MCHISFIFKLHSFLFSFVLFFKIFFQTLGKSHQFFSFLNPVSNEFRFFFASVFLFDPPSSCEPFAANKRFLLGVCPVTPKRRICDQTSFSTFLFPCLEPTPHRVRVGRFMMRRIHRDSFKQLRAAVSSPGFTSDRFGRFTPAERDGIRCFDSYATPCVRCQTYDCADTFRMV